uniref:Uncharacterized protein n=1 Tax=Triticum urartu TaxID=4572 RepID=A0A8R7PZU4_TRIUA
GSGRAELAREPDAAIGDVEEHAVVLLLHAGQHVEPRVHPSRRARRHGQARDAARRAVDHHVLLRQRHGRPGTAGERKRHARHPHAAACHVVARVEPAQRSRYGRPRPVPERVAHRGVHGGREPREHGARIHDRAAGACGRVERRERRCRHGHGPAAHADADHVDVVQGGAVGVVEQRRRLDPLRLPGGAEPQRPGEVGGLVAREAVGEDGAVRVLGLRQEGQRPTPKAKEPLRRHGPAGDHAEAPKRVRRHDGPALEGEGILPEYGLERGRSVRQVERARRARAAGAGRGTRHLRALRRAAPHGPVRGRVRRGEGRRRLGCAADAGAARDPGGVVAGVDGDQQRLRRRAEPRAGHVVGDAEDLPARRDRHERPAFALRFGFGGHGSGERSNACHVGGGLPGKGDRPSGEGRAGIGRRQRV